MHYCVQHCSYQPMYNTVPSTYIKHQAMVLLYQCHSSEDEEKVVAENAHNNATVYT